MKKKVVLAVLAVIILMGLAIKAAGADWYKGIIHFHSKCSDGTFNLDSIWQSAQDYDAQFVFMTDHIDCFGDDVEHKFQVPPHWHEAKNLYDDYVSRCYWLSSQGSPLMIAGFEFPLENISKSRHMLVLAADKEEGENSKYWYLPVAGYDEIMFSNQIAKRADALINSPDYNFDTDYIPATVIAHPSLWNPPFNFLVYKEKILTNPVEAIDRYPEFAPVAAIEMFNPSSDEQKDLDFYLNFLQNDLLIGITCGNDSHAIDTANRYTFVNAPLFDKKNLVWAIIRGNTYASLWDGKIEGLQYEIGTTEDNINTAYEKVDFNFKIVYPRLIIAPKTICLFRDGVEIQGSRQDYSVIPLTTREIEYSFTDYPSPGYHNYAIYSPGQLLTSPIQISVDEFSEEVRKAIEEGALDYNEGLSDEPIVNIVLGQNDPYQWMNESFPKDAPKYYTNRFYWQSCVYAYLYFSNLSPGLHSWKTAFVRPNGSVSCSTNDSKYINSYDERFSEVIYFKPNPFDSDWVSGTWQVKLWLDGKLVQTATYENIGDGFK